LFYYRASLLELFAIAERKLDRVRRALEIRRVTERNPGAADKGVTQPIESPLQLAQLRIPNRVQNHPGMI
jgi:hypothetical protein